MFAAEDEGRTEDPTELRKRREREKGRVPKSAEIPAALGTLGGLIVLFASAGWILSSLARIMKIYVGNFSSLGAVQEATMIPMIITVAREFFMLLAPFFIAVMVLGIVGNISQTGFLFSLEPLRPKLSNISFTFNRMVERIFFSKQIYVNLAKTIIKVALITFVSYLIISDDFLSVMKTGSMGVGEALRSLGYMSFKLALVLIIILLVMSIPDYLFQRSQFIESLKMTKQEVKQEYREQEGDPQIKARQRQRMQRAGTLSFYQGEGAPEGHIRVQCKLSCGGHTERPYLDMPADGKGAKGGDVMTKTHATGAAASYGARYILKGIFNIAVGEEDKDGNDPAPKQADRPRITEDQVAALSDLIEAAGATEERFCAHIKVGGLDEIFADKYQAACAILRQRIERGR